MSTAISSGDLARAERLAHSEEFNTAPVELYDNLVADVGPDRAQQIWGQVCRINDESHSPEQDDDHDMSEREEALPIVAQAVIDQGSRPTTVDLGIHTDDVEYFDCLDYKYPDCEKYVGTYGGSVWKTFTLKEATYVDGFDGEIKITYYLRRTRSCSE